MTSTRPYLIRAFYDWIEDNNFTPYILVDASFEGVEVPNQFVEDRKIILNISSDAIQQLRVTNQIIEFEASFSGQVQHIFVPIKAVEAIYAYENGRGMVFSEEEEENEPPPPPRRSKTGKPKLTVLK